MTRCQRGFTLVELMISVAILSVIAAIAIPAYRGYIREAQLGVARSNMDSLRIYLEDYQLDNGAYFAGTYSGGGGSLETTLGWSPDGDQGLYNYTVTTSASGDSYNILVQSTASSTWVYCEDRMSKCCDSTGGGSPGSCP